MAGSSASDTENPVWVMEGRFGFGDLSTTAITAVEVEGVVPTNKQRAKTPTGIEVHSWRMLMISGKSAGFQTWTEMWSSGSVRAATQRF